MKKSLLKYSVALLATPSILFAATSPELSVTGKMVSSVYGAKQKVTQGKAGGSAVVVEDSAIRFTVKRESDSGIEQKIFFELNGVPSMATGQNPAVMKQVYIQLNGKAGSLWIGNVNSITKEESICGGKILLVGPANYTSKLKNVFNMSSGVLYDQLLVGESLSATKIKYLSPYIAVTPYGTKVQAGVDFTPNSEHKGDAIMTNNKSQAYASQGSIFGNNMISYVVKARQEINPELIATVAFSGLTGQSRDGRDTRHLGDFKTGSNNAVKHNLQNYRSYNIGGKIEWRDTTFVLAYQNNGRSAVQKARMSIDPTNINYEQYSRGNAGRGYEVAIAQKINPLTEVSLGGLATKKKHAAQQHGEGYIVSANGTYQITNGLKGVIGASWIKQNTSQAGAYFSYLEKGTRANPVEYENVMINDNKGAVVAAGLAITF